MIKILFVHRQMDCGGVEKALFDLISLLDRNIFDMSVLVQKEGGIWEQKFIDAGIRVRNIYDCQKASKNPVIKGINFLKRLGLSYAWTHNGKGAIAVALPDKYDIIVAYGNLSFDEMCFYRGAKTVKYFHCDPGTNEPYREYVETFRDVWKKFDRIVCVSEASRKSVIEITDEKAKTEMHYNPLNSDNVRQLAQQEINIPMDRPYICAVGRLSPEKGFVRLVQMHKNLLEKGIMHRLVIVGDGPQIETIWDEIIRTGTQDSVLMLGYQPNPYPYMKRSAFLVSSSFTEGLPVTAMEALSLGIPIVSAVPSIGEIFGEECCGIITENDDDSLQAGIERMLSDPEFYKCAKQGAQNRSVCFSGAVMAKEIEQLFLELMN